MTAKIINGKEIALEIRQEIASKVNEIKNKYNSTPCLAVILVGNDPASEVYVGNKEKACEAAGIKSLKLKFSSDITTEQLIAKINELNNDNNVHGILVQLPLPKHIDSNKVIHTINCNKDVDGFNIANVGKLAIGQTQGNDKAMVPCTPLACIDLLKRAHGQNLRGLKAVVIGSSNIVGRPVAQLLLLEKCTVTITHSATKDLKAECLEADIIIAAAGVVNLVKKDMVKKGAIIIDVGINRIDIGNSKSRLVGDVDFENIKEIAGAITPVPGGVGPMTITYLLKNTLDCFFKNI